MKGTYAYYPGCSALKSATELDQATRALLSALEIPWTFLDEAACCGSRECGGLKVEDEHFALANNARTLAMAEETGASILLNVCSTCQLELTEDNLRLKQDKQLNKKINRSLEAATNKRYNGTIHVKNLLHVLIQDIGVEKIKDQVVRPLKGIKFAPFYGCHILRPSHVHDHGDDPRHPRSLGTLISAVGGEEVWFDGATKCCGFHSILVEPKPSLKMSGKHLLQAKKQDADYIVTPCPLCFTVLDGYQSRIEGEFRTKINLPVLHLPQMIGLAIGIDPDDLGLSRHLVNPFSKIKDIL